MSKTLIFLKENGIDGYNDLVKKSAAASGEYNECLTRIKGIEKRLDEISQLQKYIGVYGKTRGVYAKYRASGWDSDFFEIHQADITLHKAAKNRFDSLGYGKNKKLLPMQTLKQEYTMLLAEKKRLYSGYHTLKEKSRSLLIAKRNTDRILSITPDAQNHDASHDRRRRKSHEI